MLHNIKSQFMPKDYQLNIIRQLHNLRQKSMTMKEYVDYLFIPSIRAWHTQGGLERLARYINGLIYDIQDELSLLNLKNCRRCISSSFKGRRETVKKIEQEKQRKECSKRKRIS